MLPHSVRLESSPHHRRYHFTLMDGGFVLTTNVGFARLDDTKRKAVAVSVPIARLADALRGKALSPPV
jgi:hypothetical protein